MGPSGSGKTTLLNIIATILRPSAGGVTFNSIEPYLLSKEKLQLFRWQSIGYLHQEVQKNFIPFWTLRQNLDALISNNPRTFVKSNFQSFLERVGLDERYLDIDLHLLSGGEQQRIGLLLLLYRDPEILILDEPTSFLDVKNKKRVLNLINNKKIEGKTIILASHDPTFIDYVEDVFYLNDGKIVESSVLSRISEMAHSELTIMGKKSSKNWYLGSLRKW
ncbi:MAG: putative ABC transporter ATP-binding protein [Candidatus Heimdallarchaeota archaeon LC_3]|nr:MAG: putative ABC transporter ATP-binding protein [Candidatus Heimdallarchaeota archaeon LC_3]